MILLVLDLSSALEVASRSILRQQKQEKKHFEKWKGLLNKVS